MGGGGRKKMGSLPGRKAPVSAAVGTAFVGKRGCLVSSPRFLTRGRACCSLAA